MLTVTMQDLYPFDSWNYVFGWANYVSRTGVFSFGRYHPDFNNDDYGDEYDDEEEGKEEDKTDEQTAKAKKEKAKAENELLENACYVMVHEIGHMYGMTHCTFYECIMNGFNSYEEQRRFKRCKLLILINDCDRFVPSLSKEAVV